jgi:hypothetical protein
MSINTAVCDPPKEVLEKLKELEPKPRPIAAGLTTRL